MYEPNIPIFKTYDLNCEKKLSFGNSLSLLVKTFIYGQVVHAFWQYFPSIEEVVLSGVVGMQVFTHTKRNEEVFKKKAFIPPAFINSGVVN